MVELEKKFEKEITKDCTILAARHPLPNWAHIVQYGNGLESVWVYKHPDNTEFSVKIQPEQINQTSDFGDFTKDKGVSNDVSKGSDKPAPTKDR